MRSGMCRLWYAAPVAVTSGASPANTTSGMCARTAAGSAVINCVKPGPQVTVATPTAEFLRA